MPLISACIGSIEFALASIAKWPTSCTRAIQALSSPRLRMVWYLLRSILVFRAASARAGAPWGGRGGGRMLPPFLLLPLWLSFTLGVGGGGGGGGIEPEAPRSWDFP